MLETELYEPVKKYLELNGYTVKGEIGNIDVYAVKDTMTIAVELKVNITLKLIYQAIDRQKLADDVYIAVPSLAIKSHRKNLKKFLLLLKRLSIGLLVVKKDNVEVLLDPVDYNLDLSKTRSKKKHIKLITDFTNLESNENQGGSKGRRMTVYREKVIKIAKLLNDNPGLSPKKIKEATMIENTYSILQKNYYNWFMKKERGSYQLSIEGQNFINQRTNN
ncbi:MAG: DUF2161 family putative PD-(D/E)XK-type phosphodiesterase [Candidatus Izemoplasmatales bacterium]